MRQFYDDLFHDWEIAVAKKLINDYILKWHCLRRGDFEDILWECLLHWYEVKGYYSPDRGASMRTYMGRVARNKLQDIIRRQSMDKRKILQYTISIEEKIGNDEDSRTLFDQLISSPSAEAKCDPVTDIDKQIDISRIMKKLNPRQKRLCEMLESGYSMTEISECLETPRSTLYDEIKQIRKIFEDAGLKDYLG